MPIISLEEGAKALQAGRVIASRTETFFGLAADPFKKDAVEQLAVLKGRGLGRGIPLIISSPEWIESSIDDEDEEVCRRRQELQRRFWPGPMTLIFAPRADRMEFLSPLVPTADHSIAVRVSSDESAVTLASACNGAITTTSANPAGMPPPRTVEQVQEYFPNLEVVESPPLSSVIQKPSTILDVRMLPFRIVRDGLIPQSEFKDLMG